MARWSWSNVSAAYVALLCSSISTALAQDRGHCVDVALVLAIDGSGSVDDREYRLQQQGIATSFRDPDVLAALRTAGTVSVAAVFWGDATQPAYHTETVIIRGTSDANQFSQMVERRPRLTLGNTGLGAGLSAALDRVSAMGCAHRAIINISGDGRETSVPRQKSQAARAGQAKDRAQAMGVTVNALVISGAEPGLAEYYAKTVIAGHGSSVMDVDSYEDYAAALKRKLIREITPSMVSLAHEGR